MTPYIFFDICTQSNNNGYASGLYPVQQYNHISLKKHNDIETVNAGNADIGQRIELTTVYSKGTMYVHELVS